MKKWTIEDSRELYNISGWGTSYFGINDKGDVYVTPCKDNTQIDLRDNNRLHLVYLYRVYNEILGFKVIFFPCFVEARRRFFDSIIKDIRET